jgi:5-methyltetrahydrofolate--homocysteine methyltransferase
MVTFDEIADSLVQGDELKAAKLTQAGLEQGMSAIDILNKGFMEGMKIVGDRFRSGDFYMPEMLIAGEAMKSGMAVLKPAWEKEEVPSRGSIVIGTVEGDVHDIGKNLVIMMLQGSGWSMTDVGVDVPATRFCSIVRELKPDILGMSALLTTTIPRLKEVIDALKGEDLRDRVKIMVGGVAVSQEYADRIGADGYGANAVDAIDLAERLMKSARRAEVCKK